LDNSNISGFNENLHELIIERKKAMTHCLDLECRNAQLQILIEKLHRLTHQRENLCHYNTGPKVLPDVVNSMYLKNTSIEEELQIAKQSSRNLEESILDIKSRIISIDQLLKD